MRVSELEIGERSIARETNATRHVPGAGGILGQIETIGWTLEHVGYVFVRTGSNGKDMGGASMFTVPKGEVAWIYLFRRAVA